MTESQTVHDFLPAIQQQAIEMISYDQISLKQIASLSADARYACDFQTLLIMQLDDHNKVNGNGILTPLYISYALMLQCILARDGLAAVTSFNPRIAEPWLVEKMLGQFDYAMQQLAVASKDTIVGSIDML